LVETESEINRSCRRCNIELKLETQRYLGENRSKGTTPQWTRWYTNYFVTYR